MGYEDVPDNENLYVQFQNQRIPFSIGETLYDVLLENKLNLFWGNSILYHCKGKAICGMCAIKVYGKTSPPSEIELNRLKRNYVKSLKNIRLACQCTPLDHVVVEKTNLV